MSGGYENELTDFSQPVDNHTVSSRSRRSIESLDETPVQDPFVDQTENLANNQPSQPYQPVSGNDLLSNGNQQYHAYGQALVREWAVEWTAWLIAAISLVALIILFAVYSDEPLRQWKADITPATAVAILSQLGQTSVLAPVTACICQSMWLWLHKESQATSRANASGNRPNLIMMQEYNHGSRGPIDSLLLLWKHPTA
ncbi:MAG: hypothetical protein Q9171_005060 [Xanthocarpia ochracea]